MNNTEKVLKAVANRRRLAILKFLKNQRDAAVGEIAHQIRLSFKATSKHLNILANADLLEKDQRGLAVYYELSPKQPQFIKSLLNYL